MDLTILIAALILSVSSAWLIYQTIAPDYTLLFPLVLFWNLAFFLVSFGMFRLLPLSPRLFNQFSVSLFLSGFAAFVVLWSVPPITTWTLTLTIATTGNPPTVSILPWGSSIHWLQLTVLLLSLLVACWIFLPLPKTNSQFWLGSWLGVLVGSQLAGALPIAIATARLRQSNGLAFLGGFTFGIMSLPVLAGPPILNYWRTIFALTWQESPIKQLVNLNTTPDLFTALLPLAFCTLWGMLAWRKAWWHASGYTRLFPYFCIVRRSWIWTLIAWLLLANPLLVWWGITWSVFPVLVRCPSRVLQGLLFVIAIAGSALALYLYLVPTFHHLPAR